MYIFDCLYGKMEFNKKDYKCMLSPEMQRLREVRLGNVNSLFLTGSANNNRYEHSIGTAYLAKVNIEANKTIFPKQLKEAFVHAALFHDLGNGPFGHSYEYIREKQGFDPEKSIANVVFGRLVGSHKKATTCEPFYLGLQNQLSSILSRDEINTIDEIVSGDNPYCSKILSSVIDIDNIDNVYRMAFHMGINVDKKAPIGLAKGLICKDNEVFFRASAVPYLYNWYETRSKLYKMLLYNPQDFAAKCMLSELMENVLRRDVNAIQWHYTDSELISLFMNTNKEYWDENALVPISYQEGLKAEDFSDNQSIRKTLEKLGISVPEKARFSINKQQNEIGFEYYSTEYIFRDGSLFKKGKKVIVNPKQLATRLMRGNLYGCIAIFVSPNVELSDLFLNYGKKEKFEMECNYFVEKELQTNNYQICFHAIVDKNKTNRQIEVQLESGELFQIGENTHDLIIGAFVKNYNLGLINGEIPASKRMGLSAIIQKFLMQKGIPNKEHRLYSEVDGIE